jgi:hypothetical protein
MPQINISDATFQRLQKHAEPLVDDIESVINRLIDDKENKATPTPTSGPKDFSGKTPDLTYTKLLSATVGGKTLQPAETTWNQVLVEAINQAAEKLNDKAALLQLVVVNRVDGEKTDHGYRYLPKAGVSVQGQDAKGAWKGASHILRSLKIPGEVVFIWYDNEKAAHPNQSGKILV